MAQLAGLGGLGALINSIGGSGSGGYKGYQGSIPKYTASRTQLPIPPSGSQSAFEGASTGKRRPGSGGVTYFTPMQYVAASQTPAPAAESQPAMVDLAASGPVGGLSSLINKGVQGGSAPIPNMPSAYPTPGGAPTYGFDGSAFAKKPVSNEDPFYQSPEFKAYQKSQDGMMGTMDVYMSPYFGQIGSGSSGRALDEAYERYKNAKPTDAGGAGPTMGNMQYRPEDWAAIEPLRNAKQESVDIDKLLASQNPNLKQSPLLTLGLPLGGERSLSHVYTPEDFARDEYLRSLNPTLRADQEAEKNKMAKLAALGSATAYAQGGITTLGSYSDGGRLLRGPGDGVSDDIPAIIGQKQPARLADGEFVIPARIVSEIGNGSTDAGARKLYAMMDRVQKARGKTLKNVAANTKADKHLPA
jgi:hypothetical protein